MVTNCTTTGLKVSHGLLLAAAAVLVLAVPVLRGQEPRNEAGDPRFQSASITASATPQDERARVNLERDGRFTATNVSLRQLLETAYRRHAFDQREISGGPAWIDTDRFDVVANVRGEHVFDLDGAPRQTWLMLQTLLNQTFQLKVHSETREQPGYALVLSSDNGRLGPQLGRSAVDCAEVMTRIVRGERPTGPPRCGFGPYPRRLVARAVAMPDLASYLSRLLERPVVDHTALTGNFDLEVEGIEVVQPGPPGPSTRPSDTTRSIVDMLPEQLGLRLEDAVVPVEIIVIEDAERPSGK